MSNYIRSKIAAHRAKSEELHSQIAGLEHERALIEAEIRAYEDALSHMPAQTIGAASPQSVQRNRNGKKGLSSHWAAVLAAMAEKRPRSCGYDFIERVLIEHGREMPKANIRGHMLSYIRKGYIERTRPGRFRPTESGIEAAGLPPRKSGTSDLENEAPGSDESGAPDHQGNGGGTLLSSGNGEAATSLVALPGASPAQPGE